MDSREHLYVAVHRQAMISVLDQGLANELFKCQNVFYGGKNGSILLCENAESYWKEIHQILTVCYGMEMCRSAST